MKTQFSIIIPTYNRADSLLKTVQSVLHQNYRNFELIIVDDGSTDNTGEIVESIQDTRILYFKKANEERAVARNFGINKASGDYITFLDSDDLFYDNHLAVALELVQSHEKPQWFHLAYEIKDESGKIIRRENRRNGNINRTLITGNHLSCIGVFVRNDVIKQYHFNEDPELIGSEDYELWLRLASRFQLYYTNTVTSCMIQHASRSVISAFNQKNLITRIEKIIRIVKEANVLDSNQLKIFVAHRYFYLSLHLAILGDKLLSIKYLRKALATDFRVFRSRKILGIIKNLLP